MAERHTEIAELKAQIAELKARSPSTDLDWLKNSHYWRRLEYWSDPFWTKLTAIGRTVFIGVFISFFIVSVTPGHFGFFKPS